MLHALLPAILPAPAPAPAAKRKHAASVSSHVSISAPADATPYVFREDPAPPAPSPSSSSSSSAATTSCCTAGGGDGAGRVRYRDLYGRAPALHVESVLSLDRRPSQVFFSLEHHPPHLATAIFADAPAPAAVLSFHGMGTRGSIRFRGGHVVQLERWLKKPSTFGCELTRQFKASDGMYYEWRFRETHEHEHEWTCVQLGAEILIAHYDVRNALPPLPSLDPAAAAAARHRKSFSRVPGNVFTVHPAYIHLAVELLASLLVMRRIHADIYNE